MRILFAAAALAVGLVATPSVPPRVVLTAPVDTVALYDSIYHVAAIPYSTTGKRSGTTKLAWAVRPAGVIAVTTSDKYNQQATIAGVGRGQAWAVATWTRTTAPKGAFSDSVLVTVHRARVVSLSLFGLDTVRVGETRCIYGLGHDRLGGIVTGAPVSFRSTDTTIAQVGSGACPDTTVDPARVP